MGALLRGLQADGRTQIELAKEFGTHQTYVSALVNAPHGKPRGIGAEQIRRALEEHRINPWYFYVPGERVPDWRRFVMDVGPPSMTGPIPFSGPRSRPPPRN